MILVTAATGKTASKVVAGLARQGHEVRALSRDASRARGQLGPGVDIVAGDWAAPGVLDAALDGVDRLFLVLGSTPDQEVLEKSVVDAAVRGGNAPHVVKLSTFGTDLRADEIPPYRVADWHRAVERHLADTGLPSTVLRPNAHMDNLFAFAATVAAQDSLYNSTADGVVTMVDVRDIADVAVAILAAPERHVGRSYDITGPAAVNYGDVAATMTSVLGRPITYVPIDEETSGAALRGMGLPGWLIDTYQEGNTLVRRSAFDRVAPDLRLELTGQPRRDLVTFVRDHRGAFSTS